MNEHKEQQLCEPEVIDASELQDQDDRNPGSFFRIPAPPALGKMGWSLN